MFHHYYHIYADGVFWPEAAAEHIKALHEVDSEYRLVIGVVGEQSNRETAIDFLKNWLPVMPDEVHEFKDGWEQQTLELLRADVSSGVATEPILYTHTKAAVNKTTDSGPWRTCMERNVVVAWQRALDAIQNGESDTVGAHWLTPKQWPGAITSPFYGGNYWWSSPSHIKRLPPFYYNDRWEAERWLGLVEPKKPIDVVPGNLWPGFGCSTHWDV